MNINSNQKKLSSTFIHNKHYQQCEVSVMDTISDPDITFDKNGISNYYYEFQEGLKEHTLSIQEGELRIKAIIKKIKIEGRNKVYNCIIGLSGGVDSSYIVYLAKKYELRPLVVHFDNGWNSELAVQNIECMVNKLGFDLYTYVVEWKEFKDIQLSYFKASVVDIEVVTDHAITGTIARLCKKHKIKYSLSGSNVVTECIMPKSWIFNKNDHVNLTAIHKEFGSVPLKTYPKFNTYLKKYCNQVLKLESIALLNYLPFNKEVVKDLITRELGWKDYGGKHYESIFTRFYQAHILPEKFGIDKRKAHLSNLIFSNQITKEQALEELKKPLYESSDLKMDKEFVLKKLDFSEIEFDTYLKLQRREHSDFNIEISLFKRFPILNLVKPIVRLFKSAK